VHRAVARSDPFRAIADPTRRAILDRLRRGPVAAGSLASAFEQSRPAISKHLRVLREARIVVEEKRGRERLYRLTPEALREVAAWIEDYRTFWHTSLDTLKHYLEESP
jgi:DNA-binding transcriptional ArsR family regulator